MPRVVQKPKMPDWSDDDVDAPTGDEIKDLRSNINELLKSYGIRTLSMDWWSNALGVSRETWFRWESGRSQMPVVSWSYASRVIAPQIKEQIEEKQELARDALS